MGKYKAFCFFYTIAFLFFFRTWGLGQTHYPADILGIFPIFYNTPEEFYRNLSQINNVDLFDVVDIFYPQSAYLSSCLQSWQIPQWDPYSFCGHSLITNGHSGFYYPIRILCHLLVKMPWSHDLFLFLHLGLAGWSLFIFCREANLSVFPSLFAGSAYQFSGFSVGWFEHEHVLVYSAWLPLILHCYSMAARRRSLRWLCGATLLLGMLGTVGMMQFWAYCLIIAFCWGLYLCWEQARWQAIIWLIFSSVLALTVSALALWPQLVDLGEQSRPPIPWTLQVKAFRQILFPLPIAVWLPDFVGNPVANFHIQRSTEGGNWIYSESYIYAGILPVLLAPLSWHFKNRFEWKFFILLPLLSAIVCTTPLFIPLSSLLPGFDKTIITRILAFWPLCLCILSAFGLQAIQEKKCRSSPAIYLACSMIAAIATALLILPTYKEQIYKYWLTNNYIRVPDPPLPNFETLAPQAFNNLYSITSFSFWWPVVVLLVGISILFYIPRSKKALWALVFLASIDPAMYSLRYNTAVNINKVFPVISKIVFLKKQQIEPTGRILNLGVIRPNALFAYRLPSFDGDESLYPKATQDYANAMANQDPTRWARRFTIKTFPFHTFDQRLSDLASVNWLITRLGVKVNAPWELAYSSSIAIYHNPSAMPRVSWIPQVQSVSSNQEALIALMSPKWQNGLVVIEGSAEKSSELIEPVALDFKRPQGEEFIIEPVEKDGWLLVTEGYHKGWTATQEDKACPIYRANGMFMAIKVKAGEYTHLKFQAKGWREGLATSFFSLALLLALAIWGEAYFKKAPKAIITSTTRANPE